MNVKFTCNAWDDYISIQKNDQSLHRKVNELIKDISRNPYDGLGKPEALKYNLAGCWSRRISGEHRLVYQVDSEDIIILSCKYHYDF